MLGGLGFDVGPFMVNFRGAPKNISEYQNMWMHIYFCKIHLQKALYNMYNSAWKTQLIEIWP